MTVATPSITYAARLWGWLLASGIVLVGLGFLVFSLDADTIGVLGIFAGIAFIVIGINFLLASSSFEGGWKWVFIIGGVIAIAAGIVAFANPEDTVYALSMLVGWFLLIAGILDVIRALVHTGRHLWWLGLLAGLIEIALGAWAVNDVTNSVTLLVVIIGVYCMVKGIAEIFLAFQLRAVKHELERRAA